MDSLKFILGVIGLVVCIGGIFAVIWVLLFGIPQGMMDGGTLVEGGYRLEHAAAVLLSCRKGGVF
ncbi:MAG: hypothetical protein Q4F29_07850 [Lachnospiraceae bacterium]|nr:hypothetical protein [Lachnospiraceae bacterium]